MPLLRFARFVLLDFQRDGAKLFALIDGNPTLLEAQARAAGYSRACATAPNLLDLGEIEP